MARTKNSRNSKNSINGNAEWREVAGPFGLEIRVSARGDLEVRGRIRSAAELDAMMGKLKMAVEVEYEFQRAREREAVEGVYRDSAAEQIALFERAAADWPRIPVLGESFRGSGPASGSAGDRTGAPADTSDVLLGQSGRRKRKSVPVPGSRNEEKMSA